MRVLIIPEDSVNDQFILKPLFTRLFNQMIGPHVRVVVYPDRLGGVGEALKVERMIEIFRRHRGMTDIFILCVDRDGVLGRRSQLNRIEEIADNFFAENAWEEVETWVLAGLDLPSDWRWQAIRAEISVKEFYFEKLARMRGFEEDEPGGGRRELAEEAARRLPAIRQKCREDFDALARRLENHVSP